MSQEKVCSLMMIQGSAAATRTARRMVNHLPLGGVGRATFLRGALCSGLVVLMPYSEVVDRSPMISGNGGKPDKRTGPAQSAFDVVDDARSRHRMCEGVIVEQRITGEGVHMQVSTIGVDLAKNVLQVHGVDSAGKVIVSRQLRRKQVIDFFSKIPPCLVGMEACGTAHYWAREVSKLGHTVRLMPPSYVKGYVKRSENDAADAAAICEAVTRPSMRFVPVKSADQQALLMLHRTRDL